MRALIAAAWLSLAPALAEAETLIVVRTDGTAVHFEVEIARTSAERRRGLMERQTLAPRSGMWFDFGVEAPVAMWMKNTLIALDMLFVDANGRIVFVQAHAKPLSLTHIVAPLPARYVLEVNAGEAATYGLAPDDRVLVTRRGPGS